MKNILLVTILALFSVSCERSKGPAEKIGEAIDDITDSRPGEKVRDAVENATGR